MAGAIPCGGANGRRPAGCVRRTAVGGGGASRDVLVPGAGGEPVVRALTDRMASR